MNDTDIWSRVTCSMAKEVRMCIHTTDGKSLCMSLISVQVNYVWKMKFTFKYPQLHNILSQTYVYINFLTGNDIKETRSRIYWHIIAGSQYSAKWYMVNTNCCTITAAKPVHNTIWCSSVPSTVTELQIYLNCGSVLGWGNRSLFPSVLTRSGNPSALLSMRTGGSFTGNNKAVAQSWPLTCIQCQV
jgi:hypothetical protein